MLEYDKYYKELAAKYNLSPKLSLEIDGEKIDCKNIISESMVLTRSLCESDRLEIGGCNASQFEITLHNLELSNKEGALVEAELVYKDDNYAGEYNSAGCMISETEDLLGYYDEGNIVQYDGEYYQYNIRTDTEYLEETEKTESVVLNFKNDYSSSSNSISSVMVSEKLENTKYIVPYWEEAPEGTEVIVKFVFKSGAYYMTQKVTNPGSCVKLVPYDNEGRMLIGWFVQIKNSDKSTNMNNILFSVTRIYYPYIHELLPSDSLIFGTYVNKVAGYVDTSNMPNIPLFSGKIYSAKKQKDRSLTDIVAYDELYYLSNKMVKEWFNSSSSEIVDKNYKGYWISGTNYAIGNKVIFIWGNTKWYITRIRDYNPETENNLEYYALDSNPYLNATGVYGSDKVFWSLDNSDNPWNTITLVELMEKFCLQYNLGIPSNFDEMHGTSQEMLFTPIENDITALQFLKYMCNWAWCSGYIDSEGYLSFKKMIIDDSQYNHQIGTPMGETVAFALGEVYADTSGIYEVRCEGTEYVKKYYKLLVENTISIPSRYSVSVVLGRYIRNYTVTADQKCNHIRIIYDELENDTEIVVTAEGRNYNVTNSEFVLYASECTIEIAGTSSDDVNEKVKVQVRTLPEADKESGKEIEDFFPCDEPVREYWEEVSELYSPYSKCTNVSNFIEQNTLEYSDDDYTVGGNRIVNESGEIIFAVENKKNAIELVLPSWIDNDYNHYRFMNLRLPTQMTGGIDRYRPMIYTPCRFRMKSLPFLECGDFIVFENAEYVENEEGEVELVYRTKRSMILSRRITGISALIDEIEATF